jgi:hypothetical protein
MPDSVSKKMRYAMLRKTYLVQVVLLVDLSLQLTVNSQT